MDPQLTLKVKWHHTLRFKLFLLMTMTALVAVIGISLHNGLRYWEQQKRQSLQEAQNEAIKSANSASGTIELWSNMVDTMMHETISSQASSMEDLHEKIGAHLFANREFVSMSLLEITASREVKLLESQFTPHEGSPDFSEIQPKALKQKIGTYVNTVVKGLAKQLKKGSANKIPQLQIFNVASRAGTNLIEIRKVFQKADSKGRFIALLHVWPTRLESLTRNTRTIQSDIIDKNNRIFLTAAGSGKKVGSLFQSPNLANLNDQIGLVTRTFDQDDVPVAEVIAKIPKTSLVFTVTRSNKNELDQIKNDVIKTALLSWIFLLLTLLSSFFASSAVTRKINEAIQATMRIAAGDLGTRVTADRKDEVGLLAMSVNNMASRISNLLDVEVEAARQEKELKTAQAVQQTLFKENSKHGERIQVQGHFEPASECAGDWWFDIKLSDTRHIVIVADATGHGASAALIVALAFAYFQTLAIISEASTLATLGPKRILEDLNRLLVQSGKGKTTMTMFLAEINTESMSIKYANAGHVPPLLIPQNAADDRLPKGTKNPAKRRLIPLLGSGVMLGFDPSTTFEEHESPVRAGDRLFFYTDGLIECLGVDGKAMTPMDLRRQLAEMTESNPGANLCETVVGTARERLGSTPRADDITVVVAEIEGTRVPMDPPRPEPSGAAA